MGANILVVDDEPDVAQEWAKALKIAGHSVKFAVDPKAALAMSRTEPFDLAIVDYMMPSISGIELLNNIRKVQPFIRSIIVSGKLDSTISEDSVLAELRVNVHADVYLHKPVATSRLKQVVFDLLSTPSGKDWNALATTKLEASTTSGNVRAAEKSLKQKRAKKR